MFIRKLRWAYVGFTLSGFIYLLSGCAGTPITAHPTDEFVDTEFANTLIGVPKESIYEQFGEPRWELEITEKTYLIYTAAGEVDLMWDLFMPFILLPAEAYDGGVSALFCAVFEVDKSGLVTTFKSDWARFYAISDYPKLQTCMGLIPKDVLLTERDQLRNKVASEGDKEAIYKLEKILLDEDVSYYKREYHRKLQREGDASYENKMELARLGELDPFGFLSGIERGQPGTVELDLCAKGKTYSVELFKGINQHPIYISQSRKGIRCSFILPAGQYHISYMTDLVRSPSRCDRENASGFVTLRAGHKYKAKTLICRSFCCYKKCMSSSTTWIEDMTTGETILGSSDKCPN